MFRLPLDDKVSCHPVFALQGLFDVNPSGCQGIEFQGLFKYFSTNLPLEL